MTIFLLTLGFLLIIVTAMSVGIIFANKPIKGSCGGMSALGIDTACDICGGDMKKCEEEQQAQAKKQATDLAYDASENK